MGVLFSGFGGFWPSSAWQKLLAGASVGAIGGGMLIPTGVEATPLIVSDNSQVPLPSFAGPHA